MGGTRRNAVSLDEFWRKWNLPVHEWMRRHVFLESIKVMMVAHQYIWLESVLFLLLHFSV